MNKYTIYFIVNNINKYLYIGSTCNFVRRKKEHLFELLNNKHHNTFLQEDFNKFGIDSFSFEINQERYCSYDEIISVEYKLIENNKSNCYNIALSGNITKYSMFKLHPSKRGSNSKKWSIGLPKKPIYDYNLIDKKLAEEILSYKRKEACYIYGISYGNYEKLKHIF